MNPYLEHPRRWQGVHNRLIAALADELADAVYPNYYVTTENHTYIVKVDHDVSLGKPDVAVLSPIGVLPNVPRDKSESVDVLEVQLAMTEEVNHYYVEVREVKTHTLVTTIELLSPANKVDNKGRATYIRKRERILQSWTNFVEIDLLRVGKPIPLDQPMPKSDYRILVSRWWDRPKAQLFAFNLRTAIPDFQLPLNPNEEEPTVNFNDILHRFYQRARFSLLIDYSQQPVPPLSDEDWAWAQTLHSHV